MTWIIEFRGDLSEESPLNMDGSTSLRAVSLVLGDDLPAVLTNLLSYTKARGIAPTTVNRYEDLSRFTPTIEDGYTQEAINKALKQVNRNCQCISPTQFHQKLKMTMMRSLLGQGADYERSIITG